MESYIGAKLGHGHSFPGAKNVALILYSSLSQVKEKKSVNGTEKKSNHEILLLKELLKPIHSSPLSLLLLCINNPSSALFVHCVIFITYKSNPFSPLLSHSVDSYHTYTYTKKLNLQMSEKNRFYVSSSSLQFHLTYTYSMLQTKNKYCISGNTNYLSLLIVEKEMATHSSVLAWRIPGTGEPCGLPSMGSHRVV